MTIDLSISSKSTVEKRVVANTGLLLGTKILSVFLGLGSLWLAAKFLTPAELGVIFFLHAYMLFFSEVMTFNPWQSIIRFGTDDIKDNDANALALLLNFSLKIDFFSALIAFALSLAVFQLFILIGHKFPLSLLGDELYDLEKLGGLAALYCLLIPLRQRGTSIGVFRLFDKFNILAVQGLVMPAIRLIGAVVAAKTGAGFYGFLLAWFIASLAAYLFFPLMVFIELKGRNLVGPTLRAKASLRSPRKGLWAFMVKSKIDAILDAAHIHLPVLLVMGVFGSTWVAVYRIAEEAAKLLSEGFKLLDQVIYPELARMVSLGESAKIGKLVVRAAAFLLTFGLVVSTIVHFAGPSMLKAIFSEAYMEAAPLASLLLFAAAFTGITAPLYPVLYAADRPERAIYTRGSGVIIYILSFFFFAALIGRMAPGIAAILGNLMAVIIAVYLTKRTLKRAVRREQEASMPQSEAAAPTPTSRLKLIGQSEAKLWGLSLADWQARAFKKAGIVTGNAPRAVSIGIEWVLSSAVAKAFAARPNTALIVDGKIIGVHAEDTSKAEDYIGCSAADVADTGLVPVTVNDLDDGYNKALRKTEPPYALNISQTPPAAIMKRQYASSYKGITDFVTKWFWPIPAFYFTRLCAAMRLTPNMVTTVSFIFMLIALYYFWQGQWALGFITGWFMTFLDTVDGKLARTTMTYSWWGNIYDHGIDLIHPPFWYAAWFVGLGGQLFVGNSLDDPLFFALIAILVGYVVDRLVEGIFLWQHGFHIHVWTKINSAMRFVIARRNPNMFIFMIAIMLMPWLPKAGEWGFVLVAIWTWICIFFNVMTVLLGTFAKAPLKSWMNS